MKNTKQKSAAVVLAAGMGSRMKSSIPKQFMLLQGRPLITYALEAFENSPIEQVVLVTGAQEVDYCIETIVKPWNFTKVKAVVPGGKERFHSVYEGLKALEDCDWVLIHDGARPLVTEAIIEDALKGAEAYGACVIGVPVKDTIKVAGEEGWADHTLDRSCLWQIQTPQAFSYDLVRTAYDRVMSDPDLQRGITDDAMVVETAGDHKVKLIFGSYSNIKITTPEDMAAAKAFLELRSQCQKTL